MPKEQINTILTKIDRAKLIDLLEDELQGCLNSYNDFRYLVEDILTTYGADIEKDATGRFLEGTCYAIQNVIENCDATGEQELFYIAGKVRTCKNLLREIKNNALLNS